MSRKDQSFQKVIKVIKSCRTIEQCEVAFNMLCNYVKMYKNIDVFVMREAYIQQRQKVMYTIPKDQGENHGR